MRCACIDIGSNTTRLLVADLAGDRLAPVLEQRAFTPLGRACPPGGALAADVVAGLAEVVAAQVGAAREHGAEALRIVATAALRRPANGAQACAAVQAAAGVAVELLDVAEEARLAFAGATAGRGLGADALVAVVDAGGGSCELIAGTRAAGVAWTRSLPLGTGDLAAAHLRSDPPTAAELDALRAAVAAGLADVAPPPVAEALAVGGSATSLRRLVGGRLDRPALAGALTAITRAPAAEVAARHALDPARVRLLPAALILLAGVAEWIGPLTVARGGLREGVVHELARG